MSLIAKMMGDVEAGEAVRGPYDALLAAFVEVAAGRMSAQTLAQAFGLDAQEQAEAQSMFLAIKNGNAALSGTTPLLRLVEVDGVFRLANSRALYTTEASVRARLGL